MEVGIGRGSFLKKFAVKHPEINYIGIETKEEVMLYGVKESHEEDLKNIKFIWQNAVDLKDFLKRGSGKLFEFLDPGEKKAQQKKIKADLSNSTGMFGCKGEVPFKTDHEEYLNLA